MTKSDKKMPLTYESINHLIGIKESFELSQKLYELLLDDNSRSELLNNFMKYDFDMSCDCLRDYFQTNNSDRNNLKQDYTPDCICKVISGILPQTEKIIDVCSGTGALAIGCNKNVYFQCEEISEASIPVLLLNLCLRGLNATVLKKNVITKDIEKVFTLTKNGQFSDINLEQNYIEEKSKVIVSNPPYSLKWEQKTDERFSNYDLPPSSKADYVFVLDILNRLDNDGKGFVILPHGVLFRGANEGKIRKQLIENNFIESIIGLPEKLFLNTDIPTIIMVLSKAKRDTDILFIDASKLFIKNGNKNNITPQNITNIVQTYKNRQSIDRFSNLVKIDEVRKNDYNLNIPRYVDTSVPEQPVDLKQTINEILRIEKEIDQTNASLAEALKQLDGTTSEMSKFYKETIKPFIKFFLRGEV